MVPVEIFVNVTVLPEHTLVVLATKLADNPQPCSKTLKVCVVPTQPLAFVSVTEINPFEDFIDTFSFDYDIINNTESLLITL